MEELIVKAKQGDLTALEEIIVSMKNDLYKIARARFDNNEDAEDAVQETIIAVIKSIKKVHKLESFKPWVIKILINKCNTIYKKRKKYAVSIDEIAELSTTDNNICEADMDFYLMLKDLNYKEKLIMLLFYSQDYSIKEISKVLKINENTVKTNMFRAKAKIKNNYIKEVENGRLRYENTKDNEN